MKKCLLVISLLLVMLICGCASSQYQFDYQEPRQDVVWPPASDTPRMRYLGLISGEDNFKKIKGSEGFARSGLSWFGSLLFGERLPRLLNRPQSGVIDEQGQRLYVADIGRKAVFVFDIKNGKLDVWEGVDEITPFIAPIAICLFSSKQVFISDSELGYITQLDAQGKFLARIGENRLIRPTGLVCDKDKKRIYVADSQAHKIHVFSADGEWLFEFGKKGAGNGELNSPTYLAFSDKKLYVSDTLNARIQIFSEDGNWLSQFGKRGLFVGDLPRPKGVAIDSDKHVYVVESFYDHLILFDREGNGLMPIGGSGNAPGQFNLPAGVWIDKNDVVYVADMFNGRIMVFQYLKQVTAQINN